MNNIVEKYFEAFAAKDMEALSNLYHDDIVLNEWNMNKFVGKAAVLEANRQLFAQFKDIDVTISSSGEDGELPLSLNEIVLSLDGHLVRAVDAIQIIDEKIIYIMAYRGF
jgi:ketosteroid isomerase-like protein